MDKNLPVPDQKYVAKLCNWELVHRMLQIYTISCGYTFPTVGTRLTRVLDSGSTSFTSSGMPTGQEDAIYLPVKANLTQSHPWYSCIISFTIIAFY